MYTKCSPEDLLIDFIFFNFIYILGGVFIYFRYQGGNFIGCVFFLIGVRGKFTEPLEKNRKNLSLFVIFISVVDVIFRCS
jgi:hypothetical protein